MADIYVCKNCGRTGTKNEVSYRIIDTRNDKVKFKYQLCEECFNKLFERPPNTENKDEQSNK